MKKAILTTFLALFLICPLSAQNWSFLGGNDTLNFNKDDVLSLIVDSADQNRSFVSFMEVLNDTIFNNYLTPITKNYSKPNMLGPVLIQRNDSSIIINQDGDSLYFRLGDRPGSYCRVYNKNNRRLISRVDSIKSSLSYPGDTLKYISFQFKDSLNNLVTHPINQKTIIISKTYGIMRGVFWYHFPINTAYSNKYSSDPWFDRVLVNLGITNREYFDYQIGDIYHLKERDYHIRNHPSAQPENFTNEQIINKIVDSINQKVSYQIEIKRDKYEYLNTSFITVYSFESDTIPITFHYNDSLAIPALGYQPILERDVSSNNEFISIVDIRLEQYDGRTSFTIQSGIFDKFQDTLNQKWTPARYRISNRGKNIEGICSFDGFRDYHNFTSSYHIKELIYFRQGNYTWGTPRIVTGIDQEVELKKQSFQIFPNPTSSQINIESKENIELIRIIDLKGQVQLEYNNPNLQNLDVSFLENGVYLLEAYSEHKEVYRAKLLIRR